MKKRIAYISLYFFTVLLIFILQKPLFMLYNGSIEKRIRVCRLYAGNGSWRQS